MCVTLSKSIRLSPTLSFTAPSSNATCSTAPVTTSEASVTPMIVRPTRPAAAETRWAASAVSSVSGRICEMFVRLTACSTCLLGHDRVGVFVVVFRDPLDDVELGLAVCDRHAIDRADERLGVVVQGHDRLSDHAAGRGHVLAQEHGVERFAQPVVGPDFADLADLLEHLCIVHRLQRILVLHLGNHQGDEFVHVDLVERVRRARRLRAVDVVAPVAEIAVMIGSSYRLSVVGCRLL